MSRQPRLFQEPPQPEPQYESAAHAALDLLYDLDDTWAHDEKCARTVWWETTEEPHKEGPECDCRFGRIVAALSIEIGEPGIRYPPPGDRP